VNRELFGELDGTTLVNGVTSDIHDTTQSSWPDWDHDGVPSISCLAATDETFGTYLHLASKPEIEHDEL
jgi:hypothetical protein